MDQCQTSSTSPNSKRKLWQINEHIAHEGISNENQSAYRVFHSTEIALLKIQNDIATSMDKGAAVGLVLLDSSAACDTIEHSILFSCLQHWYGIDGVVLIWVQSYLNSRKQLFNSLMGFPRTQSWGHSFLSYIQPHSVQSYLNST